MDIGESVVWSPSVIYTEADLPDFDAEEAPFVRKEALLRLACKYSRLWKV